MKTLILCIALLCSTAYGQVKITELPALTNAGTASTDVFPIVDTTGPTTKKIEIGELDLRWVSTVLGGVSTGIVYDNQAYAEFQEQTASGDNYVRLRAPASLTGDVVLTLPPDDGDADECLTTDGSGVLDWGECGGGAASDVSFTPASGIAASNVQDAVEETYNESARAAGQLFTGDIGVADQGLIYWRESSGNGTNYVSLQAPAALGSNVSLVWPADDGDVGECLQTNGSGSMDWGACNGVGSGLATTGGTMTGDILMDNATSILFAELDSNGSHNVEIKSRDNLTASYVLTLPDNDGDADQVLTTDGSGNLSWEDGGGGGGLPTTGGTMTGNLIMDNETEVRLTEQDGFGSEYVGLKSPTSLGTSYTITLPSSAGTAGQILVASGSGLTTWGNSVSFIDIDNQVGLFLRELDANGSNFMGIKPAASIASNFTLTFPDDDGDSGEYLKTDGSGNLSWDTPAGGGGGADVGLYCKWVWAGASNASWAVNSATMADLPLDTDFADPTVTTSTIATAASVTCSAPGTKVPQGVTADLPAGEYHVVFQGPSYSESTNQCFTRLSDSTNNGENYSNGLKDSGATRTTVTLNLDVVYGSTTSSTFKVQGAGTGNCGIAMNTSTSLTQAVMYLYRVR